MFLNVSGWSFIPGFHLHLSFRPLSDAVLTLKPSDRRVCCLWVGRWESALSTPAGGRGPQTQASNAGNHTETTVFRTAGRVFVQLIRLFVDSVNRRSANSCIPACLGAVCYLCFCIGVKKDLQHDECKMWTRLPVGFAARPQQLTFEFWTSRVRFWGGALGTVTKNIRADY